MLDVILDTLMDTLKILPFLFLAYLLMEFIEHKTTKKSHEMIQKAGKVGPLIGGLLGVIPQCGFSVAATNFYAVRIISLGTLIAVYLSTSDEMLPILLSEAVAFPTILAILGIKLGIGIVAGFLIDGIAGLLRKKEGKKENEEMHIEEMCDHDHCDCKEEGIFKSAIKHTLNILFFLFLVSLVLNALMVWMGQDTLANVISNQPILGPILACLIGLIPNCASSVVLTKLWLGDMIPLTTMIGGLLTNAGVGLLVLFRVNKELKKNIGILGLIYFLGFVSALLLGLTPLNQLLLH